MVIFHISFDDTAEEICHQKSGEWWKDLLNQYFLVIEGMWMCGKYATFVCQHFDAKENLKAEEVL
jgi:hypothetical protein